MTVVSNPETGHVVHVAPGRGKDVLLAFYEGMGEKCREAVSAWTPYISATLDPGRRDEDRVRPFHVAKHLGDAVDKVRRAEHRALVNGILVGTKWQWLKGPSRKTHGEKLAFARLRAGTRRTAHLGAEGSGRKSLELSEQNLGAGRMAPVAGVGIGLRSGAGPEDRG